MNSRTAVTDDPDRLRLQFGLSILIDPLSELSDFDAKQLFFRSIGGRRVYKSEMVRYGAFLAKESPGDLQREIARLKAFEEREEASGLCDYTFDLSKPLAVQIEDASKFLAARQESKMGERLSTPRPRRDNWPLYLRVLDARDSRATYGQILQVLWPSNGKTEQSVRDVVKAAEALRDNFPV